MDYCCGQLSDAEISRVVDATKTQQSGKQTGETVYQHLERVRTARFADFGLKLQTKAPRYTFVVGHCWTPHRLSRLERTCFKTVVTLRHPLLAVISALRRKRGTRQAHDILNGFDAVLRLHNVHFVCVDLWQHMVDRYQPLFKFLGLRLDGPTQQFIRLNPTVNGTVCSQHVSLARWQRLGEARDMLINDGRIHPSVAGWWSVIQQQSWIKKLRMFGYDV
jgi:hypothetical protein